MAPSEQVVIGAIRIAVKRTFNGPGRDDLTVNTIRSQVEDDLDLLAGFLKEGAWKQKSKNIVKAEIEDLVRLEEVGKKPPPIQSPTAKPKTPPVKKPETQPVKKGVKRSSDGGKAQPRKRQKTESTLASEDEESVLTSLESTSGEESYDSKSPTSNKPKKSEDKPEAKSRRKEKVLDKEEEPEPATGAKQRAFKPEKKGGKRKEATHRDSGTPVKKVSKPYKGEAEEVDKQVDSDSDMSVVLDEAPRKKSKTKTTSKAQPSAKSSKPIKTTKIAANLSPEEAELKTLQSQLTKCGVRKVWPVILKDYGSDTKGKIRHLKGMLRDVGMEGRFSEAKAKEIKEAKELMEDLEAVKEGEAKWGMGRERRSKKAGGGKMVDDSDEDADESARSRSVTEEPPPRVSRRKMDLAFLGDESDSEE